MLRRLKAAAWGVEYQDQKSFVLLRARTRVGVCLQSADRDVAYLPISGDAAAAARAGSAEACVMANGRFSVAARALAEEQTVLALHCSQMDLLPPRDRSMVVPRSVRGSGHQCAA
ncbi:hypothetical protein ACXR8U_00075 [Methylobacterium radiotolerans]|jgi:hypothetical protein|uniref:hypothetical protein n=1 Tax=Methylobacterium TaxID=407 RepID=UPI000403DF11|nr:MULTISPECIES: hypothetical protein [Methylobacterium]KZC00104.1 hypothetical protein AU375_03658 [Methylobacterium radiotolerans]MBN6819976.1 hypothetical protein [Methylobacterium organophilum]GAN48792.1 hypothetical protein ME121_2810 [Methylobacterium sp. ME121]